MLTDTRTTGVRVNGILVLVLSKYKKSGSDITSGSVLTYLAPQDNFSWVPNCSVGTPEFD